MFSQDIHQLYLVLFGKYLKNQTSVPAVEKWGLTLGKDEKDGSYCLTFLANESAANVDMEDLEIISNFFGTSNINIGSKTHRRPCKSCQFQTVEKLSVFILGSFQQLDVDSLPRFGSNGGILRYRTEALAKYNEYVDQHTCV